MQPGNVVKLKSGGARMTIVKSVGTELWSCVWWVTKDEKFEERIFPTAALELA